MTAVAGGGRRLVRRWKLVFDVEMASGAFHPIREVILMDQIHLTISPDRFGFRVA